jgi:major vault protein
VLAYNRSLRQVAAAAPTTRAGVVSEGDYERSQKRGARPQAAGAMTMDQSSVSRDTAAMVGDVLERGSNFTQPRTIVINTKYEGVPTLNLWVGYAMMVVDKQGRRRVELGPKTALLEYDESLEILELSTGKPKSTERLLRTVYLRVLNNKVSDVCEVETSDHVNVDLKYSMRVNFTGEPTKWFEVENYVKFLCDHVRSVLKGTIKKVGIEAFYADAVDIVRDTILGKGTPRPGMLFPENGMHVTDVEVLGVEIGDPRIADLLGAAELETMQSHITLSRARRNLVVVREQEAIRQQDAEARTETSTKLAELETRELQAKLAVVLASVAAEVKEHEERKAAVVARNAASDVGHHAELARRQATAEFNQRVEEQAQALRLEALRAEVEAAVSRFGAAQPGFSEALLALGSQEALIKIADAMSVQSFVGGKTLTDVVDRVFAGTPLESLAKRLAERAGTNGEARDR